MAIFAGPNVDDSTIIFRVDASNPKLVGNDTLMSLPNKESRSVNTISNDYAYNDNLNFTPYSPLVVSNLNALTVFAFVDDTALGAGILLSMASDTSSTNLPLQATVDTRTDTTTSATGIELGWYKPLYEVSVGFDARGGIIASYRQSTYEFTATHAPLDTINNIYKIVFECISQVSTDPISIYVDNQLISKSISATGTSYFEDWPVSLFNRANSANYAQFGLRSVIVYSGVATEDQTEKINNLVRR